MKISRQFLNQPSATPVEYAVMACLISIALAFTASVVSAAVTASF
jgi:Flp pilus assembly pilin Flp